MIFRLKMEGYNSQRIAETLNDMGVLPPAEYKRSQGLNYDSGFKSGKNPKWEVVSVNRILTNEMYVGTMVQGLHSKINYKVKRSRAIPKEDWIRVENTHEAIIEKSVFNEVQRILEYDTRTAPDQNAVYPFSGLVVCGDCGQNMNRRRVKKGKKQYPYFHCSTYKSGNGCSSHLINADKLEAAVLDAVRTQIELALRAEEILQSIDRIPENQTFVKTISSQINEMKSEAERYRTLRIQVYTDLQDGVISKGEFEEINRRFTEKLEAAEQKMQSLIEAKQEAMRNKPNLKPWIETFRKYRSIEKLDRCIVVSLIDRIIVHDKNRVTVVFHFQDEIQNVISLAGLDGKEVEQICGL